MQKALSGVMNLLQANADKTTLFEESAYLLKETNGVYLAISNGW